MSWHQEYAMPRLRLAKAVAIVAALVLAIPCVDAVARIPNAGSAATETPMGIDADALVGSGDAFTAISRIEEAARSPHAVLDDAFEQEVGYLLGARDARVDDSGLVVGYVVDESCQDAFERLNAHMAQKGWESISLGGVTGATYVKDKGELRWALATCTQVGSSTSIVIRSART